MNQEQKRYVSRRLLEIKQEKLKACVNPMRKYMTPEEKYNAIKSGKAKLKSKDNTRGLNYIQDYFSFPQDEVFERQHKEELKAVQVRRDKINSEYTKINDKLHLGEAEDALKLIEAFSKF